MKINSKTTGLNMSLVIQLASQDQNVDPLIRDHSVEVLTRHIDDALKYQRDYGSRNKSVSIYVKYFDEIKLKHLIHYESSTSWIVLKYL